MLSTRSELLEKIRLGEDSFIEFKEVRFAGQKVRGPTQHEIADELAAFANATGGVLLLGVQDKPREVVGIPFDRLDMVESIGAPGVRRLGEATACSSHRADDLTRHGRYGAACHPRRSDDSELLLTIYAADVEDGE